MNSAVAPLGHVGLGDHVGCGSGATGAVQETRCGPHRGVRAKHGLHRAVQVQPEAEVADLAGGVSLERAQARDLVGCGPARGADHLPAQLEETGHGSVEACFQGEAPVGVPVGGEFVGADAVDVDVRTGAHELGEAVAQWLSARREAFGQRLFGSGQVVGVGLGVHAGRDALRAFLQRAVDARDSLRHCVQHALELELDDEADEPVARLGPGGDLHRRSAGLGGRQLEADEGGLHRTAMHDPADREPVRGDPLVGLLVELHGDQPLAGLHAMTGRGGRALVRDAKRLENPGCRSAGACRSAPPTARPVPSRTARGGGRHTRGPCW